jgi:hypothetical protein
MSCHAAAHEYGTVSFISDNDVDNFEWGGNIHNLNGTITGSVKKMRLADYVIEKVINRKIPKVNSTQPPSILMKMDIEGSELEVTTDLIVTGAMQVYGLKIF